ncbi:MAG: peptidase domain-containing ABC transporter [Bacteroidia bacterium]|nr:peptidase domain-containing ABC transporter [Bacteroidia bacterium]
MKAKIPFYASMDEMDCGPACLRMAAASYGKYYSLDHLRELSFLSRDGVSLHNLSEAAKAIGFETLMLKVNFETLESQCPMPCVVYWNQNHFILVTEIITRRGRTWIKVADPANGIHKVDKETFLNSWADATSAKGVVLLLEPTEDFYLASTENTPSDGLGFLYRYLKPYTNAIRLVLGGMIITTLITLVFPFLTQFMVDVGIGEKNVHIVWLILVAQFFLFLGESSISVFRSWIMLHMNSRVSISIISEFLAKLIRLPIRFFDIKSVGDITQRIEDHGRIESFLTGQLLSVVFSMVNVVMFSAILLFYNWKIFAVFLVLSAVSIAWVFLFMKHRRVLDYKRFQNFQQNQQNIFELISGMQEIKLNQAENKKRWEWERVQVSLFQINLKSLLLEQYQQTGYLFFANLKNIILAFIAAYETLQGNMTLGMLLGISYIIGQTNGPLEQLVSFFRAAQDARISIDRLQEIHHKEDEDRLEAEEGEVTLLPESFYLTQDIEINDLSFQYEGPSSPFVLEDVNLIIPAGKITALVGASGSGKTTLMKLLLRFYEPTTGEIQVGEQLIHEFSARHWRSGCGVVMQDGYLFSDTILNNITLCDTGDVDQAQLGRALYVSNLQGYVDSLPLGLLTKLGANGLGLSGGQRQRLLIARAVYKNPSFLLFDEATSALDAKNERIIVERLQEFFADKTVIVIAHRLSTVKSADQIIVLDNGKIVETGSHLDLTHKRGEYFHLVKNQLELGS